MSKQVNCEYYVRHGYCGFGDTCRHIHPPHIVARPRPAHASNQRASKRCNAYWQTGECRFGFKCEFNHEENPALAVVNADKSAGDRWTTKLSGAASVRDGTFPTYDVMNGRASDGLLFPSQQLATGKAKPIIQKASNEETRVTSPVIAEQIVHALMSGNRQNDLWTYEDRQSMLSIVAKVPGDVILRLGEIVRWPNVTHAGRDNTRLSFQSTYMGLVGYLTSEAVLKSTSNQHVSALYSLIEGNLPRLIDIISTNIKACLEAGTFKDTAQVQYLRVKVIDIVSGLQIFKPIAVLFQEFCDRYRSAITTHPELPPFFKTLVDLFDEWADLVQSGQFDDALAGRSKEDKEFFLSRTRQEFKQLLQAVQRSLPLANSADLSAREVFKPTLGVVAALNREYDGPGELSAEGVPRHDNDHEDIQDIQIPPTTEELLSSREPYLPGNLIGVKHHLPEDSMDKILDIQFRLLRADATTSLRGGIKLVLNDLDSADYPNTQVAKLMRTGGGRFTGSPSSGESIMMPMTTHVEFCSIKLDHRFGLVVHVRADPPPGPARSRVESTRRRFWEQGKRLPQGGLVALVTKEAGMPATVSLAILTTFSTDIKYSERSARPAIEFGLAFVNNADGLRAAHSLRQREASKGDIRMLIESPVLYESVRPFLQALQNANPSRMPLSQYIKHGDLKDKPIQLPEYAGIPGFSWDLKVLLKNGAEVESCVMDPSSPLSIASARQTLHEHGKLDPSQTDAVVEALTREISLIQGPPGTGKTFTGVELLRLLFANNIGPIILLAFTNHALDHILRSVYDNDVTKEHLLRLGSRSKDEIVSQFSLEVVERTQARKTSLHAESGRYHAEMKHLEDEMKMVSTSITSREATTAQIMEHLEIHYPLLKANLERPPEYAAVLFELENDSRGWSRVGKKASDNSLWSFWKEGHDLRHLETLNKKPEPVKPAALPVANNRFAHLPADDEVLPGPAADSDDGDIAPADEETDEGQWSFLFSAQPIESWEESSESGDSNNNSSSQPEDEVGTPVTSNTIEHPRSAAEVIQDKMAFLDYFSLTDMPPIPTTIRSVEALLEDGKVWSFSETERARVAEYIAGKTKTDVDEDSLALFESLAKRHAEARKLHTEARDNIRLSLLKDIKLLGSTTTGAAKLPSVLKGFSPKVLVIEEAGQVLEAHVLATLFPSIQHVIAIGDPLQLRPNLNSYELSADSPRGKEVFRFDISLMERLSAGGLPMSQLQVQRRMSPQISSLIRNTLYPLLQDNDLVTKYPDVRGMAKNVFFLDHRHRETHGGDDGASKSNDYEVAMACDLALYLLKQGCYSKEGDVVILCAYLGQLVKVRDALRGRVMVLLDERDQREIDKRTTDDLEEPLQARQVEVGRHVLLRTVDNFQGEEAKVVILSLVRNSGDTEAEDAGAARTIGFLKSNNRTNVALSRAKHGMYILGNAPQLAVRSPMWETIIDELTEAESIGNGWPIACARHPETLQWATQPGQIQLLSPDGGCMRECGVAMPCGHLCRQKCHPDDPEHTLIDCRKPCNKLHQPCGHPCSRLCFEECASCEVVVQGVQLPCGHSVDLPCSQTSSLDMVFCQEMVTKYFEQCEHSMVVRCGADINEFLCKAICGLSRDCCGRTCGAKCWDCQRLNPVSRAGPALSATFNTSGNLETQVVPAVSRIHRSQHAPHACGKLLPICGHQCSGKCSKDHVHPPCTAECLQQCEHKKCGKTCRKPCQPCQEPCKWTCPHHRCTLPCSMPCDRLPCDEPCPKILRCGHPCPSLCGEPCSLQVCVVCATPDQKSSIVDFIMQQTSQEVVESEPQTRFITLACGHFFTVDTLDGHCKLSEYYEVDESGKVVGVRTPEPGFKARPVCPNCRGAINSPRYNRITRRALIDIQEQHAITSLSHDLTRSREALLAIHFDVLEAQVTRSARDVDPTRSTLMPNQKRINALLRLRPIDVHCIPSEMFESKIDEVFEIKGPLKTLWLSITRGLFIPYKQMVRIVNSARLPHVLAYEAAVSVVFREELALAAPAAAVGRDPTHTAMLMAKRRVGAPFPRGEARFKIEALLETIKLRLKLVPLAQAFATALDSSSAHFAPEERSKRNIAERRTLASKRFTILAWAILRSCRRDADLAAGLCQSTEARRLGLVTEALVVQVHFHFIQHGNEARVRQDPTSIAHRHETADATLLEREQAANRFNTAVDRILQSSPSETLSSDLEGSIRPMVSVVLEEWMNFAEALRSRVFWSPVSMEERLQIAKAVSNADWNTGGRFYQCPAGHTFTIGECGQAMEEANCPECGARIGGHQHVLRDDNIRDMEMERLARQAGARANPHARM